MAEIDYRQIVDGLSDAVIASDGSDKVTYINAAAEKLLGWTREELVGRQLTVLMPARMHLAHEQGYHRFMATGQSRIMGRPVRVPALHRNGVEIDIELTLTAFPRPGGERLVVASMRDLRDRVELERQLTAQRHLLVQHRVMTVLSQSHGPAEALPKLLQTVCDVLGWGAGLYWQVRRGADGLVVGGAWAEPDTALESFIEAARPVVLGRGEGLPGQAWATQKPIWSADVAEDPRYVRRAAAALQGVHSAVLFPVVGVREFYGVLEFLSRDFGEPDEELTQAMATLGFQLGQFWDRLHLDAQAKSKAEWLSTTLKSIGDAVIATDVDGNVAFMNPVAEELTGWSGGDAAGRSLNQVFPIIHEETRERIETPVAKVLRDRQVVTLANHTALLAKDGTERIIEDSAAPIQTDEGVLQGVVLVFRDVTEKKHTQAELSRLLKYEQQARAEADRERDVAAFLDEATNVLGSSLEYERTLARLANLAVPKLADWCVIHLRQGDEPVPKQFVVAHVDPQKVEWARELSRRYPPDPASPRGAIAVTRTGRSELYPDISDELLVAVAKDAEHLKLIRDVGMKSAMTVPLAARAQIFGAMTFVAAESGRQYTDQDLALARELARRAGQAIDNAKLFNEAQEAIRIRDDFLSIASHELRTPLTPLQLQLQAIIRAARKEGVELSSDHIIAKLLTISRAVVRLERLVNSLLEISRITGRRLALECEEVDLVLLVRDLAERFREQAEQLNTKVMLYTPPTVMGRWDRLRLEQIVGNLLSNAIKFGSGKPIEVRLDEDESRAHLQVVDHGIGILPEDQARIFERFERAVPTKHFGGFGLGLWIVRQIVEAMGGSISVDSAVGQGAVFKVELPLEPPIRSSDEHIGESH